MLASDVAFISVNDELCESFLRDQSHADLCDELNLSDSVLKILDESSRVPYFYLLIYSYRDMVRAELARRFCDCYYSSLKSVLDTE